MKNNNFLVNDYYSEFIVAQKRTIAFGLEKPMAFSLDEKSYLTLDKQNEIAALIPKLFPNIEANDLVRQCMSIHLLIKKYVENLLGISLFYTLGYLELSPKDLIFYQEESALLDLLEKGISTRTLEIHAWLTLPSMEILDLTFLTSYGIIKNDPECVGGIIASFPGALKGGLKYHPMLLGDDYLRKIGALLELTIL